MTEHNTYQLGTERLLLRHFRPEDTDAYVTIMAEREVGKWLPKGDGYTREQTERFMEFIKQKWADKGYGIWAVTDKQTGEVFGHCGLNDIEAIGEIEVLYALGANGRGRGIGVEAARASIEFAFDVLELDHIMAVSKPDNIPSRRVMEKNGMQYVKDVDLFNQTGLAYYAIQREAFLAQRKSAAEQSDVR